MSAKPITYSEAVKLGANVAAAMLKKGVAFGIAVGKAAKSYPQAGSRAITAELQSRSVIVRANKKAAAAEATA